MLVGQLCRVCCCDASVGASRLLKAYPALSPGPHAVPHERDQWQLAPEGHAISERGKMQVSHFVGPKVCISTIRFQRAGSREGRANGASVRAQEAPAREAQLLAAALRHCLRCPNASCILSMRLCACRRRWSCPNSCSSASSSAAAARSLCPTWTCWSRARWAVGWTRHLFVCWKGVGRVR